MIDFESLKKSSPMENLNNAFNVAEQELGLSKLLDPEGKKDKTRPQSRAPVKFEETWLEIIFS